MMKQSFDINRKYDFVFYFLTICFFMSLLTEGFGDFKLFFLNASFSTYFIYLAFLFQLVTQNIFFSRFLGKLFLYIIISTFILNYSSIVLISSVRHFIIFIIYCFSLFSYVSKYRDRLTSIIILYNKFAFFNVSVAIIQVFLFSLFHVFLKPNNFLSGSIIDYNTEPEIFGYLPRAVGFTSEPAHYSILILPAAYFSLLAIGEKNYEFGIKNKKTAIYLLIGFFLSFSLVGFFGFVLCLIPIFTSKLKGNYLVKIALTIFVSIMIYILLSTNLITKVNSLPKMLSVGADSYEFTSNDLSSFALYSNSLVALQSLKNSNYLGSGFNSHKESYDKFIYKIFNQSQVLIELNREGGGSLFIRILSEFGIPGIFLFIYFFIKIWIRKSNMQLVHINHLSIIMIFSFGFRNGAYVDTLLLLFFALAFYSFSEYKIYNFKIANI